MLLTVNTHSRTEFVDITADINAQLRAAGSPAAGLCHLFVPHTTAAITINESADPSVRQDILKILNQVVPFEAEYGHLEGNSAAHIKSTLVGASEVIALSDDGRLRLGTWQGVFFCEFDGPRTRKVQIRIIADNAA
jgi:secondary thiamine-phosphate synthase enzyme